MIGTWRASFGASSGEYSSDYSEQFEFRPDGTASRVLKSPGWEGVKDEQAWISVYECDWSVSGPKAPSKANPWSLQHQCGEVSRTEPTEPTPGLGNQGRLPVITSPVDTRQIVTIGRYAFTEHGGHGDFDVSDYDFIRIVKP